MNSTWSRQVSKVYSIHCTQPFLGEVAPSVQVSTAVLVGSLQQGFVLRFGSSESPQGGPQASRESPGVQEQMGLQPRDSAVAVQERVCPGQPMMCSSQRDDRSFPAPYAAVDLLPTLDKARQGQRRRRLVPANRHAALPELAGHHGAPIGQPEVILRKVAEQFLVQPGQRFR